MQQVLEIIKILKYTGRVYSYSRVLNSRNTDIVVSDDDKHIYVDIHALNTKDNTQPALEEFIPKLDFIKPAMGFLSRVSDGVVQKNNDGIWFCRLAYEKPQLIIKNAELYENNSLDDDYGGSVVFKNPIWNGIVGYSEIRSSLKLNGGEYAIHTDCIITCGNKVKDNCYFVIDGRKITINGIIENKIYGTRNN